MIKTIKLVISENGKDIETVNLETNTDPSLLYKSLEEFRKLANAALTKLIEDSDDTADFVDEDTISENEEDKVCSNTKKRKKKS